MNVEFYKEAIYKEAIWGSVAGLTAKAAPYFAKAKPIANKIFTKELAKTTVSSGLLGAGFGALTTPEDRMGGALKGALSWAPLGAASHIGLKNAVPAIAKTKFGKNLAETSAGKYIAARPRLLNATKGAAGDAMAFGAIGALPTKENKEMYGEGLGGTVNSVASNALLGGAFGGAFGALTKVPKKGTIPPVTQV